MDTLDAAKRPRLRWWPGAPVTQSRPDAGQDHSPGDHISRDRAQDQQDKDRGDEDEHNCQRTSHSWWRAHQGGRVFRLPGKRGWPSGRHRPRRHSQNRQGKSSFRHAQKHLEELAWEPNSASSTPMWSQSCSTDVRQADNTDDATKIQTFFNTCLRRIYKIQWQEKLRNEDLWTSSPVEPGGSEAGSDTPSGSHHPAPHSKLWPGTRKGR